MESIDLRRLRWIGVALPVAFVVVGELLRLVLVERLLGNQLGHVLAATVAIVAVVAFALVMFGLIERAQRQLFRQNRELAAVAAVSTAVQGELDVAGIIDAALESIVAASGATEALVTVFAAEGEPTHAGFERRLVVAEHASPLPDPGATTPHLVEIPLASGTTLLGRMQLHLPAGAREPDLLATATLQNIGHQLACAIQIGQLVASLRRRQREGHGLYDILLQISNQNALADILGDIVAHARDLLGSDEAVMCLTETTARTVQLDGRLAGMTSLGDGTVCLAADAGRFHNLHLHELACPLRSSPDLRASLEVPVRGDDGPCGDLWVGRREGEPYTERDRTFLATLGDLASIAIASARMREHERQGAILAERERIAREMHDSLAQVLGMIHLRLRALEARPEVSATPAVAGEIGELAGQAREAYRDVREAILGLRESSRLEERGLLDGLRAYLNAYGRQAGLQASLETGLDREPDLAPRAEVQVIRVIQEALTNVRKHAEASSAVVRIVDQAEETVITVEDDGRGFDVAGVLLHRDGFGLHTMRERMELIGGSLEVDSEPGRGTRVVARVPRPFPVPSQLPVEVPTSEPTRTDPDPARR